MLCCQSGLIIRGSRTVSTTFPNSRITSKRDYDHLGSTESHTSTSRGIRDNFQRLPRPRSSAHWSRISMEFTHLLPPTLRGETQPPQHLSPSRQPIRRFLSSLPSPRSLGGLRPRSLGGLRPCSGFFYAMARCNGLAFTRVSVYIRTSAMDYLRYFVDPWYY